MSIRKKILTALFLLLTGLILCNSALSLYYALNGLNLWFQKMIPTLLPFMILSGIMVRMNLTEDFAALFAPILKPLFKVSQNGVYCIIMGFLCGFPMGAKVIAELYEREKISKSEASFLLSFCNNIGPVYFMGFALPTIGIHHSLGIFLFGMYGLPFLYGMLLRRIGNTHRQEKKQFLQVSKKNTPDMQLNKTASSQLLTDQVSQTSEQQSLLYHMNDAILSALNSITALGGYMIFFNLLNLLPHALLSKTPFINALPILGGILEISGGLGSLGSSMPLFSLCLLPFGGLSCIAQTYSIIAKTDLSIKTYLSHKLILTAITAVYYLFFFLR